MGDSSEEDEDDDAEVAERYEVLVTAGLELAITGDILDPSSCAPSVASDSDNEVVGDSNGAMDDSDEGENTQSEEEETYRWTESTFHFKAKIAIPIDWNCTDSSTHIFAALPVSNILSCSTRNGMFIEPIGIITPSGMLQRTR